MDVTSEAYREALSATGLRVVGAGSAHREALGPERGTLPSVYADPVAWLVAESVRNALADSAEPVERDPAQVAVLLVSARCTLWTMTELATKAVPRGRVSPLKFAGASPGGAGTLVCLLHGFRGPTMTLSTSPADGLPAARTVARAWLRSGAADYALVTAHDADEAGRQHARTSVLAR
ncbi:MULTISPECIES: beta-ketoacyl synthase N-terminal-like domain-containing protein [Actinosynnema]|uniref:beta-ketoacyl synthase N-terminal-like domain-containing protein n=1 Tax=Actinosynnema TaxID=40566 RepID=UPI0020A54446|nr:beta-ketoacyl synthase N-terminal-like domain-containing protein [Actinosynnema pretiosum]MCP2099798.1 Beta-ketoacyl synthase, N-terminal domain [Actinosynnema pretiosum]